MRRGVFREDLFHRLNVIRLRLPPLRERREDIPALATSSSARAPELGVEPSASPTRRWRTADGLRLPGNVRQLENVCHWLTVMAPAQVIEPRTCPARLERRAPAGGRAGGGAPARDAGGGAPSRAAPRAAPAARPAGRDDRLAGASRGRARPLAARRRAEVWDELTRQFEGA